MAEQILINIVRPDVGISYTPESPEAVLRDRLAACELGIHALAREIARIRAEMNLPCPAEIQAVIRSDAALRGL